MHAPAAGIEVAGAADKSPKKREGKERPEEAPLPAVFRAFGKATITESP